MSRTPTVVLLVAFILLCTVSLAGPDASTQAQPVISGVHVLNVGETYFEIEWETDVPTQGTVEWGTSKDLGNHKSMGGAYLTYFRTNITNLDRNTKYHFRVFGEDLSGGVGYSGDQTVTTGPQAENEGGTPGWVWGVSAAIAIVLLFYIFMIRPGRE